MTDALGRAVVSLLINDDKLDPAAITALLGAEPRKGVRKGEVLIASNGKQIPAKTGMWHFGGDWLDAPDVEGQIVDLLKQLTQNLDVWKSVTSQFYCYISVGGYFDGWTGGVYLSSYVLGLLAERGLHIDFDLYAPAASDREAIQ